MLMIHKEPRWIRTTDFLPLRDDRPAPIRLRNGQYRDKGLLVYRLKEPYRSAYTEALDLVRQGVTVPEKLNGVIVDDIKYYDPKINEPYEWVCGDKAYPLHDVEFWTCLYLVSKEAG